MRRKIYQNWTNWMEETVNVSHKCRQHCYSTSDIIRIGNWRLCPLSRKCSRQCQDYPSQALGRGRQIWDTCEEASWTSHRESSLIKTTRIIPDKETRLVPRVLLFQRTAVAHFETRPPGGMKMTAWTWAAEDQGGVLLEPQVGAFASHTPAAWGQPLGFLDYNRSAWYFTHKWDDLMEKSTARPPTNNWESLLLWKSASN